MRAVMHRLTDEQAALLDDVWLRVRAEERKITKKDLLLAAHSYLDSKPTAELLEILEKHRPRETAA